MQLEQAIMDSHSKSRIQPAKEGVGGWVTSLFGCWHKEMSRPFTSQGQTYRTCVDCGARRQFNVKRWEMQGDFYYGLPTSKHLSALTSVPAR